jgi:hypothetical protein
MSDETFSRRHGFRASVPDIRIREDAPEEVRAAILMIAEGDLRLRPGTIRSALCAVLRQVPDSNNWTSYPNIWDECQRLMSDAPWYRVYDFVEVLYDRLTNSRDPDRAVRWQSLINAYFEEAGIGWQLVDGHLKSRGPEAFEQSVASARSALEAASLTTAKQEIHEALNDLSRRPEPDLTGSVQHAMAALECTAREATGDPRATLGEILKRNPDVVPKPLDQAISKMWGYASDVARHVREGSTPSRAEAELVVGVASATCSYLALRLLERKRVV